MGENEIQFPDILKKAFDGFTSRGIEHVYLIGPRARDLASGESIMESTAFDLTVNASMSSIEDVFRGTFGIVCS